MREDSKRKIKIGDFCLFLNFSYELLSFAGLNVVIETNKDYLKKFFITYLQIIRVWWSIWGKSQDRFQVLEFVVLLGLLFTNLTSIDRGQ